MKLVLCPPFNILKVVLYLEGDKGLVSEKIFQNHHCWGSFLNKTSEEKPLLMLFYRPIAITLLTKSHYQLDMFLEIFLKK